MLNRRQFAAASVASLAFAGLPRLAGAQASQSYRNEVPGYGPLVRDPAGLLDLPQGFSYRVVSRMGERMADGRRVPDRADGMGCFPLGGSRVALVRNHELAPNHHKTGPEPDRPGPIAGSFDSDKDGRALPGGTTTIVYDVKSGRREAEYLSLVGTIRNCAGGTTPWGSWLSCEENETRAGQGVGRDHGWVFEVPARHRGLVEARPLLGLGRFMHEAAAVDPRTGIVYLTEDKEDGLFYRFLPDARGQLHKGGRLQALVLRDRPKGGDTRNKKGRDISPGAWKAVSWVDLQGVDNPHNDLRDRGHAAGGARFARGEGIEFGKGELFFTCTSGGRAKLGQVMRYRPSPREGQPGERDEPGMLQLFVESTSAELLNYGDNITVAPWGHLVVCEDQYTDPPANHLRGVTPDGQLYTIARHPTKAELAGACFSPDGGTMFVNIYSPGKTLAITGPWRSVRVA